MVIQLRNPFLQGGDAIGAGFRIFFRMQDDGADSSPELIEMAFMFDAFILFKIGFELHHHLGKVGPDGLKGAHNQPVETLAGTSRRDRILFQADLVLLIKEALDEPFQKAQGFRIDALSQGKMMDQQADPLQYCQGFLLEQHHRATLQELIGKTKFFCYRWITVHCNG